MSLFKEHSGPELLVAGLAAVLVLAIVFVFGVPTWVLFGLLGVVVLVAMRVDWGKIVSDP